MQDALAVAGDDVAPLHAASDQQSQRGHVGRPHADEGHLDVFGFLAHDLQRVEQAGQHHRGCALLVVVPDRYVHLRIAAQEVQHAEAFGLGDVLQVDAAEGGLDQLDGLDDRVGVLGVQADGHGIHPAQVLEDQRLALHDRQPGLGTDVAQAQHPRAVGDHCHRVALVGVLEHLFGMSLDVAAGCGDSGRVPDGKIADVAHSALSGNLHLPLVERMQSHRVFCWLLCLS